MWSGFEGRALVRSVKKDVEFYFEFANVLFQAHQRLIDLGYVVEFGLQVSVKFASGDWHFGGSKGRWDGNRLAQFK